MLGSGVIKLTEKGGTQCSLYNKEKLVGMIYYKLKLKKADEYSLWFYLMFIRLWQIFELWTCEFIFLILKLKMVLITILFYQILNPYKLTQWKIIKISSYFLEQKLLNLSPNFLLYFLISISCISFDNKCFYIPICSIWFRNIRIFK